LTESRLPLPSLKLRLRSVLAESEIGKNFRKRSLPFEIGHFKPHLGNNVSPPTPQPNSAFLQTFAPISVRNVG
jgi:hypothetical protein